MAFQATLAALASCVGKHRTTIMSDLQKQRIRKRLREVDDVIAALLDTGMQTQVRALRTLATMPTEAEMHPRNKYAVFRKNRKGLTSPITWVPKFTKMHTDREYPIGVRKYLGTDQPYEREGDRERRIRHELYTEAKHRGELRAAISAKYDANVIEF